MSLLCPLDDEHLPMEAGNLKSKQVCYSRVSSLTKFDRGLTVLWLRFDWGLTVDETLSPMEAANLKTKQVRCCRPALGRV